MRASKTLRKITYTVLACLNGIVLWIVAAGADDSSDEPEELATVEARERLPDIIIISMDTLRADRLGSYGYEKATTPAIDSMAKEGLLFVNATVPLPRTTPALASMVTGLKPENHGSREVWERIKKGTRLPSVLQGVGYQTIGISANSAAGPRQGLHKGFDQFVSRRGLSKKYRRNDADVVTAEVIARLRKVDPKKPLFLWVHYMDPHWSYGPPRSKWKGQPAAKKCHDVQKELDTASLEMGQLSVDFRGKASESLEDCSALYDEEIAFNDAEIGKLIEKLRELGRWENEIRIFTADHGENLGEDGYFYNHGPSLADAALRIPLIIAAPGIPAGKTDAGIAQIEDLMPTLFRMVGVDEGKWPASLDGNDLSWRWNDTVPLPSNPPKVAVAESGGALHLGAHTFLVSGRQGQEYCVNAPQYSVCFDPRKRSRPEFFDRDRDPHLRRPLDEPPPEVRKQLLEASKKWRPETTRSLAARTADFKLVARPQLDGSYSYSLYDLKNDPREEHNVIEQNPKEANRLRIVLDRWEADLPLFEADERSDEDLEELRALGYIR